MIERSGLIRERREKAIPETDIEDSTPLRTQDGPAFRCQPRHRARLVLEAHGKGNQAPRHIPRLYQKLYRGVPDSASTERLGPHQQASHILLPHRGEYPVLSPASSFGISLLVERMYDLRLLVAIARYLYEDTEGLETTVHEMLWYISAITVGDDAGVLHCMWISRTASRIRDISHHTIDPRYRSIWSLICMIGNTCSTSAYFGMRHKHDPTYAYEADQEEAEKQMQELEGNGVSCLQLRALLRKQRTRPSGTRKRQRARWERTGRQGRKRSRSSTSLRRDQPARQIPRRDDAQSKGGGGESAGGGKEAYSRSTRPSQYRVKATAILFPRPRQAHDRLRNDRVSRAKRRRTAHIGDFDQA